MSWEEENDTLEVMSLKSLSTSVVKIQSVLTSKSKLVDTVLTPDAAVGCGIEAVTVIVYTPTSDRELALIENDGLAPINVINVGYASGAAFKIYVAVYVTAWVHARLLQVAALKFRAVVPENIM